MPAVITLSHYQAQPLLAARKEGRAWLFTTPDLGLTQCEVILGSEGVCFPGGETISWPDLTEIAQTDVSCFRLAEDGVHKIHIFSEYTGRFYSLMPTGGAPTMLLSGIPMHRIKEIDPHQDTLLKIQAIKPVIGSVLDTTTGLGYTAIEASRTAGQVTTVELDPAVGELASQNPWSHALFDNPKITRMIGDSYELIASFSSGTFTRIIHDPPMFSLAGELYSGEFYRQLYRVMRNNGRLFHYIGDLRSSSGSRVAKGAARRLQEAGFMKVRYDYKAFGLVAQKLAR